MTLRTILMVLGSSSALVACGDSESGSGTGAGAGGGATAASTTGATSTSGAGGSGATSGGAGGANTAVPEAPQMKSAMKMSGALHVSWTNVTTDCDKIHVSRNENAGTFDEVYVLAGAATSQHDTGATDSSLTYCYKASCERDGLSSADSNEVCGTP